MKIRYLRDVPAYTTTLAAWTYHEFPYAFVGETLEDWVKQLSAQTERTTFVALEGDKVVGTATLEKDDLPPRPALSPWLGSVYVLPEFRGRGIGALLVTRVEQEAKVRGFERFYLYTTDRTNFYAKYGWQPLETLVYSGYDITVMVKQLL
jgi:GNAT superfamily N-acetyltransferase